MFKEGHLLITFYEHTNLQAKGKVHTQLGGKKIDEIPQLHLEVIEVPVGEEAKYKALYEQHPDVRFVEYNFIRKLRYKPCKCARCKYKPCGCRPNDPHYLEKIETSKGLQNQWGLQRINPELAFCELKDRGPVTKIAILDSGIDPNHPDLKDKIINPINFTSDNPEDYIDTEGHGTHVAGIAAAVTNNKTGIASASYNTAHIVPVKILGRGDESYTTAILKGLMYAIEQQVDVINMSFGTEFEGTYSQNEQNALEMAWNQRIIPVAARGNEGNERITYPNAYNYVLSVSATNKLNRLASFSSWGNDVGITAPGAEILSTTPTYPSIPGIRPSYDSMSGTSMSAPFVSGVAAMLRAIKPSASNQEIIQAIQRSARSLDTQDKKWDPFYGYGLLDLSAAVQEIKCPQIPYGDYCKVLGSFYGQVVDSDGNPLKETVIAVDNRTGEKIREYQTKFTICPVGEEFSVQSDGMFRLFNLPGGNYSIYLEAVIPGFRLIESIDIVPGADVYVKLVRPEIPEEMLLGKKDAK
ncbi:S8 family serine peptidase [Bacillus sp. FSL R12-0069]|uniref:S8 family serine peptidase n=1 Tax=Bacillus sp. FSL R12-0069 TaxID=2975342 RepID=UPI0030FA3D54